jgi:hypothetical protein
LATSDFFSSKYGDFGVFFPKEFFVPFALDFVCCHNVKFVQKKNIFLLFLWGGHQKVGNQISLLFDLE